MGAAASTTGADRALLVGRLGLVSSEKPWPLFAPSYLALTPHSAITFIFICFCLCFRIFHLCFHLLCVAFNEL